VFLHRPTNRVNLTFALVTSHSLTVTRHVTQSLPNRNNASHPNKGLLNYAAETNR
jgi:hypothetical protein